MDYDKCAAIKHELEGQREPQSVPIKRFFDGNDDEGSIGCNLMPHPGMGAFAKILVGLLDRSDVSAVHALITELDPGEDSWPFSDTVLVIGSLSSESLQQLLLPLSPDEVGPADVDGLAHVIPKSDRSSALVAWWD